MRCVSVLKTVRNFITIKITVIIMIFQHEVLLLNWCYLSAMSVLYVIHHKLFINLNDECCDVMTRAFCLHFRQMVSNWGHTRQCLSQACHLLVAVAAKGVAAARCRSALIVNCCLYDCVWVVVLVLRQACIGLCEFLWLIVDWRHY